jgi:hypothetical protein
MPTSYLGLARTDNGMKQSSWPEIQMINQKNYYTSVPLIVKAQSYGSKNGSMCFRLHIWVLRAILSTRFPPAIASFIC